MATVTSALVAAPPAAGQLVLTPGSGSALAPFEPDKTASGMGSLTATDDSPSWTLQAQDQGSGAGKMVAGATGCAGSEPVLADPLQVSVTSPLSGVTSAGTISLSANNQTVATGSDQPLAAAAFTTQYTQVIASTEVLLTGCVYTVTVTYTLQ